ncbi:MAG: hypothetical protein ACI4OJ_06115 [Lachnospiraceae bacterium]
MSEVYQILRKSTGAVSLCLPDQNFGKVRPACDAGTGKAGFTGKKQRKMLIPQDMEKKAYEKRAGSPALLK